MDKMAALYPRYEVDACEYTKHKPMYQRLNLIKLAIMVCCIIPATQGIADTGTRPYGAYSCIVQRQVGIQGGKSGKVNLTDNERFFLIRIELLANADKDTTEIPYCRGYSRRLRRGEDVELPRLDYWFHCLTASRLTFSPSKSVRELRADKLSGVTPNTFHDSLRGWFTLFPSGRYHYVNENFDSHDTYLEAGECVLLPKN